MRQLITYTYPFTFGLRNHIGANAEDRLTGEDFGRNGVVHNVYQLVNTIAPVYVHLLRDAGAQPV